MMNVSVGGSSKLGLERGGALNSCSPPSLKRSLSQCLIGVVQLLDIEMWKVPMDTVVEITPMSIQLSGGREVPHGSVQEAMTLQAVHGVAEKEGNKKRTDTSEYKTVRIV